MADLLESYKHTLSLTVIGDVRHLYLHDPPITREGVSSRMPLV